MKKSILPLVFFMLIVGAGNINAQELLRFGIIGGGNSTSNSASGLKHKLGFHGGAKAELSLTNHFYLDGSLLFTTKGYKISVLNDSDFFPELEDGIEIKGTLSNNYLMLPIHAGAKIMAGDKLSVFISGGPYAAYALSGKATIKSGKHKRSEKLYRKGDEHRRADFGVGAKAGIEFQKHIQLSVGYDAGLVNIAKHSKSYKNRDLTVSLGYMF